MPTIYVPGGKFSAATSKITAIAWAVNNGILELDEVLMRFRATEMHVDIGGDQRGTSGNLFLRIRYGATWVNDILIGSDVYFTSSTVSGFFPIIENTDGYTRLTAFDGDIEATVPDELWWGKSGMQSGGEVYMKCTPGDEAPAGAYTGRWGNVFFSNLPGP